MPGFEAQLQEVGPVDRLHMFLGDRVPTESETEVRLRAVEAKLDRVLDLLEGRLVVVPGLGSGRVL